MTLRTLNYGNYGIFLIMGNAGFCPSTVVREDEAQMRQILGSLLRLPVSENITPYLKVTGNANSADTGRLASIAPNFWK